MLTFYVCSLLFYKLHILVNVCLNNMPFSQAFLKTFSHVHYVGFCMIQIPLTAHTQTHTHGFRKMWMGHSNKSFGGCSFPVFWCLLIVALILLCGYTSRRKMMGTLCNFTQRKWLTLVNIAYLKTLIS